MPVIKSAIKKLRRDRKKEKQNDFFRKNLDKALRIAEKEKSASKIKDAVSILDKGVKKNLMHKNKAARIKSRLTKLASATKIQAKPLTKNAKTSSKSKGTKAKPQKKRTK